MPISYGGDNITFNDGSRVTSAYTGFKNRIINGDMRIDQRNAGASVTPADGQFITDRFQLRCSQASKFTAQQNAGSVTPPVGFSNYLGFTSSSAYSIGSSDYFMIRQSIEGFNFADLQWGTADAKTVTLSFWVRSSLTGTFGGALQNSANARAYPFTYTISAANTWEQKTITVAGDKTGTWIGATNGTGVILNLGLGVGSTYSGTAGAWASANNFSATGATSVVGTNGATFYITGVQLEVGSSASTFDYRPYGTELALCQRYYEVHTITGSWESLVMQCVSTNGARGGFIFKVTKRAAPTMSSSGTFSCVNATAGTGDVVTLQFGGATTDGTAIYFTDGGGILVAGNATNLFANPGSIIASAEL